MVGGILEVAPGLCAPVVAMDSVGSPGQMEFIGEVGFFVPGVASDLRSTR